MNLPRSSVSNQIEEAEIKYIKPLALKAVWEPKDAHTGCKSILGRRNSKGKVAIKSEKYLAQAFLHAVRMKAAKKTLKRPLKVSDIPE